MGVNLNKIAKVAMKELGKSWGEIMDNVDAKFEENKFHVGLPNKTLAGQYNADIFLDVFESGFFSFSVYFDEMDFNMEVAELCNKLSSENSFQFYVDKYFIVNFDGHVFKEKEIGERMVRFLNMVSNLADDQTMLQLLGHVKQD